MMPKTVTALLLGAFFSLTASAYDETLAAEFDKAFSKVTQKNIIKSKLMIDNKELFKMMREKKKFVFLDIRTEAEMAILGLKTPNTLEIPLRHLFEKKNLDRLPKKELIILICHSGSREKKAIMSLKMLGFKNIRLMKEGMVGLAKGATAKNAPLK